MSERHELVNVGVVRSPYKSCAVIPPSGGPATIEVAPAFASALDDLEGSSHIVVLAFLHLADRTVLKARPRKVDPTAPERGVFATRSPARPNPVSMTVVPLLQRQGLTLQVDGLDLLDGTPVVDIKAYCPAADAVFSATHHHRANQAKMEDRRLLGCLERELVNYLGPQACMPPARAGLAAVFLAARRLGIDPRNPMLRVALSRWDAAGEAITALTGALLSNGRLAVRHEEGPTRAQLCMDGHTVDVTVDNRLAAWLNDPGRPVIAPWLSSA